MMTCFRCLLETTEDSRYNIDAVDLLIRHGLVYMVMYDFGLVTLMNDGANMVAVNFAMQLVQRLIVEDKSLTITEVILTFYHITYRSIMLNINPFDKLYYTLKVNIM